jgi:hypothetical protein
MQESYLRAIKWVAFLAGLCLAVWRIVAVNLADYYADYSDTEAAIALNWYSDHPEALFKQAFALSETDAGAAEQLLRRLIWQNPADGRAYILLAGLREKTNPEQAAKLVSTGETLEPMRFTTRLTAAAFWARQGKLDKALEGWSIALELRPDIRKEFYPSLLQLADDPQTRPFFKKLIMSPPSWWAHFFDYAARNATQLDTLRVFYGWRQLNDKVVTDEERRNFMSRLEKENRWQEAYFVWINSFDEQQLAVLGNIYNGSFELPFSEEGFGWRAFARPGIKIETAYTYGTKGTKALHINFRGERIQFHHFLQYLFLTPGNYDLQGMVRPEGLRLPRGLYWTLRCLNKQDVLATSERFLGSSQWREFTSRFQIPEQNCRIQQLTLEMASQQPFAAQGEIWFDDLRIRRAQN